MLGTKLNLYNDASKYTVYITKFDLKNRFSAGPCTESTQCTGNSDTDVCVITSGTTGTCGTLLILLLNLSLIMLLCFGMC